MSERKDEELFEGLLSDYPNVMQDSVPFKVLLLVANGVNNPKGIAGALEVKPPTVIYQLKRLRDVGFVKFGSKDGKIQHYKINWEGLGRAFLKVMGHSKDPEEVNENLLFTAMLKGAFTAAGRFAVKCSSDARRIRLRSWRTSFKDFFHEFKIALIKSYPELRKGKLDVPELIALMKLLDECYKKYSKYYGTRGDLFWRIAFEEVGIVKKKFSSLF